MHLTHPSDRLGHTIQIAERAARMAERFFQNRAALDIAIKSPGQAVTEADRAVETAIRADMAETFPGEAVLGEEFGGDPSDRFWTLDPIDGTANFLNGLPLWGVAIGHMTEGMPDLGVFVMPSLGLTVAAEGETLFLNGAPHLRRSAPVKTVSLGQASPDVLAESLELHAACRKADVAAYHWRSSAVSFAWAALGLISGHFHRGTTLWDAVPGVAVCAAAGLDTRFCLQHGQEMWVKTGEAHAHALWGTLWEEAA